MRELSEEERRAMVAEAEAGLAAAWADVERRRAAGEPPPVISEAKARFRQGGDAQLRPGPGGGTETYSPSGPEQRAVPHMPEDYDRWANPTPRAWARREFVARKAGWLWAGQRGVAPEELGDGTDVELSPDGGVVISYPDGSRVWRDRQWRLHRADGPAVVRPDRQESWVAGVRVDPPIDPSSWWDK